METLQGPLLVEVDVSKLMGSESFSGGRVGARKLEDRTGDLVRRKELAFWSKMPESEYAGHQSGGNVEDASEDHCLRNTNANLPLTLGLEATQSHRNFGKVGRNSTISSKRSRTVNMDVSVNKNGEDGKGISNELSTNPTNCKNGERNQMLKQRQNSSGKRSDKRNCKVTKSNFSLKSLVGFGSASGGRNFLGMYGLKSDSMDVTKDVEDLPLRELLDGSYKCTLPPPKDKGNKASSSKDSLMQLVRDANSILRLHKSVQSQNCSCVDSKLSCAHSHTSSSSASQNNGEKGEIKIDNPSSSNQVQEYSGKVQAVATMSHAPSYTPKDMLERLALTPSKDLDSFLMDTVKPASSRNNGDLRPSKPSSQRNGLPPFPWSHTYSGHLKSVPDSAKLSTSKTVCQGRWVRVENTLTPLEGSTTGFLVDLQSLTDNLKLVPAGVQASGPSETENASSKCDSFTVCGGISSSIAAITTSEVPPAAESPRILVAAETLCKIAKHSLKPNREETIKLLKKPSQKSMRACKLTEKSEKLFIAPKPVVGSNNVAEVADGILPSKKLRLSVNFKKPDRKGPIPCSAQSIRSTPVKSFRDSDGFNGSFVNKPCVMSPFTKVMDKACSSEQKLRKVPNGVEPRR